MEDEERKSCQKHTPLIYMLPSVKLSQENLILLLCKAHKIIKFIKGN